MQRRSTYEMSTMNGLSSIRATIGDGDTNTNRYSGSPTRTIDSRDSTSGSMDTIVDRQIGEQSDDEMHHNSVIQHSTNTTNQQQLQQQNNTLTNSEIAILQQSNSNDCSNGHDNYHDKSLLMMQSHQPRQLQEQHKPQLQQQQQQQGKDSIVKHIDPQSHIYSNPVYDEKPAEQPLKLTADNLLTNVAKQLPGDELHKPKLISHDEFKRHLEETMATKAATLNTKINKKQRLPPEFIKDKDHQNFVSKTLWKKNKNNKKKSTVRLQTDTACWSTFPIQIALGVLQLVLAISLVALGSLLIVREATFATAGCGLWTGLMAAITGALGVVGLRKTQTSFLALSLICIATSTLALAITGIGLSRDVNRSNEKINLLNDKSEISAGSGLIFALFLHFIVSIISVYRCAVHICAR